MPSSAIVGAGPGMGLAIARVFGSHGFDVALSARDSTKLRGLVDELTDEGITAAAFPADVLDHAALSQALNDAATRFGSIDVLEYSPLDAGTTALTAPSQSSPSDVQDQIDFQLYGAIAATELADSGIQAAHVAIDVTLGVTPVIPGFPTAKPEEVAPVYWELHTNRDEAERIFTANQGATA
jgi:NADP-dependent 3-hydroxy acid dehydrogenase YdfG